MRADMKTTEKAQNQEEAQNQGASNMTKNFVIKNPHAVQPLQPPINSIVAAAQTAHDLDAARRKTTTAKPFRHTQNQANLDGEFRSIISAKQRHESLVPFVLRMVRLVAVQVRERRKK
jgi:hypothetical protein